MATVHLEHAYANDLASVRRPLFPAIRWGAVIAGVAVGIALQLALTLLGVATGLSATDVTSTDASTVGRGALIWAGASMLLSALAGGYVAARMSGLKRKVDGVLHGMVAWSVSTLMFATLATSATGSMLGSVFGGMNPTSMISSVATNPSAAGENVERLSELLRRQTGVDVTPDRLQAVQGLLRSGQRDAAVRYMVMNMGMDESRAASVADQALIVSGSPQSASPQGQQQANQALQTAGTAAWTVFGAVALSLALGIVGGLLGSLGARRTTWNAGSEAVATASAGRVTRETEVVRKVADDDVYRDSSHREAGYRETGHRETGHRDADNRPSGDVTRGPH